MKVYLTRWYGLGRDHLLEAMGAREKLQTLGVTLVDEPEKADQAVVIANRCPCCQENFCDEYDKLRRTIGKRILVATFLKDAGAYGDKFVYEDLDHGDGPENIWAWRPESPGDFAQEIYIALEEQLSRG